MTKEEHEKQHEAITKEIIEIFGKYELPATCVFEVLQEMSRKIIESLDEPTRVALVAYELQKASDEINKDLKSQGNNEIRKETLH